MLSPEHAKARKYHVTGTSGAKWLCGKKHTAVRMALGFEKFDKEPIFVTRGRIYESATLELAGEQFKRGIGGIDDLEHANIRPPKSKFIEHPEHKWMGVSLDGVIEIGGVPYAPLEIKNMVWTKGFGEPGTDVVPDSVFWQTYLQMMCTGTATGVVGRDNGSQLDFYKLKSDPELNVKVINVLKEMYENYIIPNKGKPPESCIMPEPDDTEGTEKWLKERYPSHDSGLLEPTTEVIQILQDINDTKEQLAPLTEKEKVLKNKLKDIIGATGCAGFSGEECTATWKLTKGRVKYNWESMAKEAFKKLQEEDCERIYKDNTMIGEGYRRLYTKLK